MSKVIKPPDEVLEKVVNLYQENLWKNPEALNYLIDQRGLKEDILKRYKVGYASGNLLSNTDLGFDFSNSGLITDYGDFFDGFIVFPAFINDHYYNLIGRNLEANGRSNHLIRYGKEVVYNLEGLSKGSIILTESAIDTLTLIQAKLNACGVMGVKLSDESVPMFRDKICFILFDKDPSGYTGGYKAAEKLIRVAKRVYVIEFPNKTGTKVDVNSYFQRIKNPEKRIVYIMKNSRPISPAQFTLKEWKRTKKNNFEEDKVDIVKIGRELFKENYYVDKGHELWVRCPHHKQGGETAPSLWIGGNKNIFNCFGCQQGGGPIKLVAWHLEMSFPDARDYIREKFM